MSNNPGSSNARIAARKRREADPTWRPYADWLLSTRGEEECFQRCDKLGLPKHAKEYLLRRIVDLSISQERGQTEQLAD
jgi:hypothetical protein